MQNLQPTCFTTWNMQGAKDDFANSKWDLFIPRLMGSANGWAADVLCLQECGYPPNVATTKILPPNTNPGILLLTFKGNWITWFPWDINSHRCNLAIVSRERPDKIYVDDAQGNDQWRPALIAEWADCVVGCIHAMSGAAQGRDSLGLVQAVRQRGQGANVAWYALGDFNCQPEDPHAPVPPPGQQPQWFVEPRGASQNNGLCTHPNHKPTKCLDYMACSSLALIDEVTVLNYPYSDHRPMSYKKR